MRRIRRLLGRPTKLPYHLHRSELAEPKEAPLHRAREIEAFLRSVDHENEGALRYLETHLARLVRTLTLVPPPGRTRRALELGAYMQMTPALGCVFGYDVRGAYYGPLGRVDTKSVSSGGKEVFRCEIDLFDAERNTFPYATGHFDVVLCCELIEHLLHDPMHLLLEINRVLDDGGALVLTTPNIASYTAVARILNRKEHPQLFSKYANPKSEFRDTEFPHVREYTPDEVAEAVAAAGFAVEYLFTEKIAGYESDLYFRDLLDRMDYPTELRGEQIYVRARKRAGAPITQYPPFLYEGC
ncbi:MAG: class I SAM-dependent methyltransferase [Bryobacteraceae bacterium]